MFKKTINKLRFIFVLIFLTSIAFSVFYLKLTWDSSISATSNRALLTAKNAEITLNGPMLKKLSGKPEDIGTVAYESIKQRLINLIKINNKIRFAYFYTQRNGKIYFLVDSEPAQSKDISPAGQEFTEADYQVKKPFVDGQNLITKPSTDRWGTWVSIFIPIKDEKTGKIKNVFGMDYPANIWNSEAISNTTYAFIIVLVLLILLITFYEVIKSNFNLKESRNIIEKIKKEQEIILDSIPAWVFYKDDKNKFIRVNKVFAEAIKKPKEEIEGKSAFDIFPKEQADAYFKDDLEVINSGVAKMGIIEPVTSPEGILWVQTDKIPNKDEFGNIIGIIGFTLDITDKKNSDDQIKIRNEELERLNKLMVGRELKMIELKKEILKLKNTINKKNE